MRIGELPGRQVDADVHLDAGLLPSGAFPACRFEDAAPELTDQPVALGRVDEVVWADEAPNGMVPPHEALDGEDAPALQGHDWLVVDLELAVVHGTSHVGNEVGVGVGWDRGCRLRLQRRVGGAVDRDAPDELALVVANDGGRSEHR